MKLKSVLIDAACERSYTLSKLRFRKRLRRTWRANRNAPVIVHTMAKVGSTGIRNAIEKAVNDRLVFNTHFLSENVITRLEETSKSLFHSQRERLSLPLLWRSEFLREQLITAENKDKWKFISLTRDPVARNISAFFQNIFITPGTSNETIRINSPLYDIDTEVSIQDTELLVELFLTKWADHTGPADFFERDFVEFLGLDVYAQAFDHNKGYQIYAENGINAIIIKLENITVTTNAVLANFLGLPGIDLKNENVSAAKPFGELYKRFISGIRLSDNYLDEMYGSRYAQHFYTPEELGKFRRRWAVNGNHPER